MTARALMAIGITALLLGAAARFADLTNSLEAAALRDMAGLCASEGACRRAGLQRSLGDAHAALARPQGWPCCDVCDPDTEAVPSEVRWVDLTEVAVALLAEVDAVTRAGRRAWFVSLLETGAWRQECGGYHQPRIGRQACSVRRACKQEGSSRAEHASL